MNSTREILTRSTTSRKLWILRRRYAEAKSTFDRALTFEPNNPAAKAERACVEVEWKADPGPLHQVLDEIRATNPVPLPKIARMGG